MGFFASKTLLSAIELNLFTTLAEGPMTGEQIRERLGLSERAVPDFTDALVALGFLERKHNGHGELYANTADTTVFLDRNSPQYIGGILEMANDRLYGFWGSHRCADRQRPRPISKAGAARPDSPRLR